MHGRPLRWSATTPAIHSTTGCPAARIAGKSWQQDAPTGSAPTSTRHLQTPVLQQVTATFHLNPKWRRRYGLENTHATATASVVIPCRSRSPPPDCSVALGPASSPAPGSTPSPLTAEIRDLVSQGFYQPSYTWTINTKVTPSNLTLAASAGASPAVRSGTLLYTTTIERIPVPSERGDTGFIRWIGMVNVRNSGKLPVELCGVDLHFYPGVGAERPITRPLDCTHRGVRVPAGGAIGCGIYEEFNAPDRRMVALSATVYPAAASRLSPVAAPERRLTLRPEREPPAKYGW